MQVDSILEKGSGSLCEDSCFINGRIFGVFDGATSLNPSKYDTWKTGGFLASNIACEIFKKDNDCLYELAKKANNAIWDEMNLRNVDTSQKENLWSTSAAAIKVRGDAFEWIQTGDSLILAIYKDHSYKIFAKHNYHDQDTLLMWKNIALKTDKTIFEELMDQIKEVRTQMNVTYGVMNGEKGAIDFLNYGKEELADIKHIIMFTDGLHIPNDKPEQDKDFNDFVKIFLETGLSGIRDYVREIEITDPECKKYPRFKQHDDIAAVSISI